LLDILLPCSSHGLTPVRRKCLPQLDLNICPEPEAGRGDGRPFQATLLDKPAQRETMTVPKCQADSARPGAGVEKEKEKAADRCSGQCPRNSEQLHPGVGRFVAERHSRAAERDTLHLSSQTRADSYSQSPVGSLRVFSARQVGESGLRPSVRLRLRVRTAVHGDAARRR
ncbi:hypothetical protein KUCAC02_006272, partial [Chaenocephalus aceratus]